MKIFCFLKKPFFSSFSLQFCWFSVTQNVLWLLCFLFGGDAHPSTFIFIQVPSVAGLSAAPVLSRVLPRLGLPDGAARIKGLAVNGCFQNILPGVKSPNRF